MSKLVCEAERPAFRHSVEFLEQAPNGRELRLDDFKARTERSDGTSATMRVGGRLVNDELGETGEIGLSGRVRLVREGGEWCISGERDGFRSIRGSAEDIFALLARGGISVGVGFTFPEDPRSIPVEVVTPPPAGAPEIGGEIVTTASGLQYVEIEIGIGAMPEPGQTMRLHYTMWVKAAGDLIDSSVGREPFEIRPGRRSSHRRFRRGAFDDAPGRPATAGDTAEAGLR